jgi:hypothetical protein
MPDPARPKAERLAEFFRRLAAAEPSPDGASARAQLTAILNAVEDELSGIPYSAEASREMIPPDGRMYPPYCASVIGPRLTIFNHIRHRTAIAVNGAIRIVLGNEIVIDKPGADGRNIDAAAAE